MMRICGCVDVIAVALNTTFASDELPKINMLERCKEDFEYRLTCWDNDILFDDYYDMADFIVETENLSKEEDAIYDKADELCAYIREQWTNKLPIITEVEFGSLEDECWVDTIYIVDCDYKEMYKQMKEKEGE